MARSKFSDKIKAQIPARQPQSQTEQQRQQQLIDQQVQLQQQARDQQQLKDDIASMSDRIIAIEQRAAALERDLEGRAPAPYQPSPIPATMAGLEERLITLEQLRAEFEAQPPAMFNSPSPQPSSTTSIKERLTALEQFGAAIEQHFIAHPPTKAEQAQKRKTDRDRTVEALAAAQTVKRDALHAKTRSKSTETEAKYKAHHANKPRR